jgi:hypothetical protein
MYQAHVQPSVHLYADYHLSAKLLEIYERATVRTCICNPSYTDRETGEEMTEAPASGWYDPLIILMTIPIDAKKTEVLAVWLTFTYNWWTRLMRKAFSNFDGSA